MEWLAKAVYVMGAILISVTVWVTKVQFTLGAQADAIQDNHVEIRSMSSSYVDDQKRLIDTLGRMDERLKNIERKL